MLFKRVHVHSSLLLHRSFFHLSKFYLDEKTSFLKQCFSTFKCRLLNNNGLMPKYLFYWPSHQGKRGPQPKKFGNRWSMCCSLQENNFDDMSHVIHDNV